MLSRFRWTTFDVNDILPENWRRDVVTVAEEADFHEFPRTPILTREAADIPQIERGRVHAGVVRQRLPWLYELYRGPFLELASQACPETVTTARDDRYALVLNVQRGTSMRFECHVDSDPLSGVLFLTEHAAGGELVVARDPAASRKEAIDQDCTVIRPQPGHLIVFDGRHHPHYARPLTSESDLRVIATMNFYTESFPESDRPALLNNFLYGDPLLPKSR